MNDAAISHAQAAFGRALRTFRAAAGLSQEELARRAGVHRNYVGDVERAEENISLVNILKLCAALRRSLAELVGEMEREMAWPAPETQSRRAQKGK